MKWFRKTKDEQDNFIFDYNNFIMKSSQKRYVELENEVKNKLDKIEDEIPIAGSSVEEKRYNLLMHYKKLVDTFDFEKEIDRDGFQLISNFLTISAMIMVVWLPDVISLIDKVNDIMINYAIISFLVLILIITFAIIFSRYIYVRRKSIKKECQEYLYYKFYYNEIKKYTEKENKRMRGGDNGKAKKSQQRQSKAALAGKRKKPLA